MAGQLRHGDKFKKIELPPAAADGAVTLDAAGVALRQRGPKSKRGLMSNTLAEQAREVGAPRASSVQATRPAIPRQLAEETLRSMSPDLSDEQVKDAVKKFGTLLDDRYVTPDGVPVVIGFMAEYAHGLPLPTVGDVEVTQRLSDHLQAEVEKCREELFGAVAVPFKTMAEASAWVAGESDTNPLAKPEYDTLRLQAEALDSSAMRVGAETRYVQLPMNCPRSLFLVGRSKLLRLLSDVQRKLSEHVGVHEWEVTRFILVGVPPAVRRWRAKAPNLTASDLAKVKGRSNVPLWFEVEIRDGHFSYEEVRGVFGALVCDGLLEPTTSSATQRAKLERAGEFIEERRGELVATPMTYTDIMAEWNATYPEDQHKLRWFYQIRHEYLAVHGRLEPQRRRGRRQA